MLRKIESRDGTSIALETTGTGPALVLVGGAFNDRHARAAGTPLASRLADRFTVTTYDRRGRGGSGDTPPWALEREVEDLAAVVEAAGGRAALHGLSSGALLVVEAALRGVPATHLVLYEAPLADPARLPPASLADELAALCAAGRRTDAATLFLTRVVGMPAPAVAGMQRAPMWAGLEALAPTLANDVRITAAAPEIARRAAALEVPTLVLGGGESPPWMQEAGARFAATLRRGRHALLAGQTHDVDPAVLAEAIAAFVAGGA